MKPTPTGELHRDALQTHLEIRNTLNTGHEFTNNDRFWLYRKNLNHKANLSFNNKDVMC